MMDKLTQEKIKRLAKSIGYGYKKVDFLQTALTHCSAGDPNNERLEFLGDSILNFIIAAELYQRFPRADEGALTRLRAKLVRGETLACIGKELNLGDYVILGAGERKSGGPQRKSILADALEAIIGAIFCDLGLDAVRDIILTWYSLQLESIIIHQEDKDPKTCLQELLQSKGLSLPGYEILDIVGDPHEQTFHVACRSELLADAIIGVGTSRRKAEQNAAEQTLRLFYEHQE